MNELVFVVPPIVIAAIFAYLSVKINKELAPLQFFFLFVCLFFCAITTSTQVNLALVANGTSTFTDVYNISQSAFDLSIWSIIFVIGIVMVMLIYWILRKADPKNKYPILQNNDNGPEKR